MALSLIQTIPAPPTPGPIRADDPRLQRLEQLFGVQFSVVDVESCEMAYAAADLPPGDWQSRSMVCREVAARAQAAIIDQVGPLLVLAIPLCEVKQIRYVAVAGVVTAESCGADFHIDKAQTPAAAQNDATPRRKRRILWPEQSLLAAASLFVERDAIAQRAAMLEDHVSGLSENLSHTYEEISLLHRIAGHLKISDGVTEVAHLAVDWLSDILSTESVVAYLEPREPVAEDTSSSSPGCRMLVGGRCPLSEHELQTLIGELGDAALTSAQVINHTVTKQENWRFPLIRELIIVPLLAGDKCLGYLAALNHSAGREFGTVEASLLNSVATMLAIHYGNSQLYQAQVNLFSGMVQSLISAIDAKDPYTCGHSDRVARIATRLGEQLGCDDSMLNTIYLSGLLHDIGKIGINDSVLSKPGPLTVEEYEHIKLHPRLGYNILKDIRQIKDTLPGVLYHHEAWDGSGYPDGLAGEDIPLLARILAVADGFDAMGSDRSYRKGMPDDRLDKILREGAGQQWDARIVEVFFTIRDEIRQIAKGERERIRLDSLRWS